MIDKGKRKALKILSSASAIAVVPVMAEAKNLLESSANSQGTIHPLAVSPSDSSELSVAISSGRESTITLTNNSSNTITVKHIHPGIVHAGERTFDINSTFENGAKSIAPGSSFQVAANTVKSTQTEKKFPRHLYTKLPQQPVSVSGIDNRGVFVHSTRSFYS